MFDLDTKKRMPLGSREKGIRGRVPCRSKSGCSEEAIVLSPTISSLQVKIEFEGRSRVEYSAEPVARADRTISSNNEWF
jgi:hypothetical protein